MTHNDSASPEPFPSASPSDGDGVRDHLETAKALWDKGDQKEAVRWLQRAATAAEEAGDDARSLALARHAADLSAQVAPLSTRSPDEVPRRPAGESGAPPGGRRPTSAPPPRASGSSQPPATSSPVATNTPVATSSPSGAPPRPNSSVPPPIPSRASSSAFPPPATGLPSPNELIAQGRAVRVAVKRSAIDGSLYVVRPLGGKPAAGAREALLILSEPDQSFFSEPVKAEQP
jgi:hypothetical protein